MLVQTAVLPHLYIFCQSIMRSTKNHTVKSPELFSVIQHEVYFNILLFQISICSLYFISIKNDCLTVAKAGWAFCNNALMVGAIIELAQFIIASKSELDNRFVM